jgi:hypothetical protein
VFNVFTSQITLGSLVINSNKYIHPIMPNLLRGRDGKRRILKEMTELPKDETRSYKFDEKHRRLGKEDDAS